MTHAGLTVARIDALLVNGTRRMLLDALQANDPNGAWTDRASAAEYLSPVMLSHARRVLLDIREQLASEQLQGLHG